MCQQGCSRPYWKPSVKGMLPLQSLIFLAGVYTNCKMAVCNTCSENAKGSLCGCVAQTSFWAEMQKKEKKVSSAFPQPARRGREVTNGENLNIANTGWFYLRILPCCFSYVQFRNPHHFIRFKTKNLFISHLWVILFVEVFEHETSSSSRKQF